MIGQTIKNTEPSPNVAVVTGAAGGIGRAIATRFAQDGTTVVLADIRAEAASSTAEAVAAETAATVVGLTVDVTDSASVKELVNQVVERLDVSIT